MTTLKTFLAMGVRQRRGAG